MAKGIRDRVITLSPYVLPELEAQELAKRITAKQHHPAGMAHHPEGGTVLLQLQCYSSNHTPNHG